MRHSVTKLFVQSKVIIHNYYDLKHRITTVSENNGPNNSNVRIQCIAMSLKTL